MRVMVSTLTPVPSCPPWPVICDIAWIGNGGFVSSTAVWRE